MAPEPADTTLGTDGTPCAGASRARRRGLLGRLRREERGATAVEFAIIAPVFFFLMFVIAETAVIFIAEQVMDNAVFETARLIRTGQAQQANMTKAQFKTKVCERMSFFVNCNSSDFYLDVKSYATFSAIQTAAPVNADNTFKDDGAYDFGDESEIVIVRAYYQWPTNKIYGGLSLQNMSNGKRLIGSFAAFRNEPYGS
jgi:Flp pilus assembly protein TadG